MTIAVQHADMGDKLKVQINVEVRKCRVRGTDSSN